MPPPPSFWKMHTSEIGGGLCRAFFAMLPDLAVRRDTRIAVNSDRSWRQSLTQPLSAGAAAKGGPSTWVVMQRTFPTRRPLIDNGPPGCCTSFELRTDDVCSVAAYDRSGYAWHRFRVEVDTGSAPSKAFVDMLGGMRRIPKIVDSAHSKPSKAEKLCRMRCLRSSCRVGALSRQLYRACIESQVSSGVMYANLTHLCRSRQPWYLPPRRLCRASTRL